LLSRRCERAPPKRMTAGEHLVSNYAERVQVVSGMRRAMLCPRIGRIRLRVGSQRERVEDVERLIAVRHGVHEPESHDLRRTVFADEHGMRAQVAMNDPVAMRVRKTARNAFDDGPSLVVLESF